MTFATIAAFVLYAIASAFFEAKERGRRMALGIDKPLEHGVLVKYRGRFALIWLFLVLMVDFDTGNASVVRMVMMTIVAMATFAISHRLTFNKLTGKDTMYLGSDALYDRWWIRRAGVYIMPLNSNDHFRRYTYDESYRDKVQKAAAMAYLFEAIALTLASYISLP